MLINGADGLRPTGVFALDNEDGAKRWKDLQNRVVEHVRYKIFFKLSLIILFIEYSNNRKILHEDFNETDVGALGPFFGRD